jgi:hypothetical protein
MGFVAALGHQNLMVAFAEALAIGVTATVKAVSATHPIFKAWQPPIQRVQRQAAGMAEAVIAWLEAMIERHPLIEDEALPLPEPPVGGLVLQVAEDSTLQVMNPFKALLEEIGRGFLAANSPRAKQG